MFIVVTLTAVRQRSLPILYDTSLHFVPPEAHEAIVFVVGNMLKQQPTALPALTVIAVVDVHPVEFVTVAVIVYGPPGFASQPESVQVVPVVLEVNVRVTPLTAWV
jgi:hypothetical protein